GVRVARYERGRVSHVRGVDLAALEDTLTTWEPTPGQRSPDRLDLYAVGEILGFAVEKPDNRVAFKGIAELGQALAAPIGFSTDPATLLAGSPVGGSKG